MKRLLVFGILLFFFAVVYADGEFFVFESMETMVVTTDDGGDSTTGELSIYLGKTRGFDNLYSSVIIDNAYPAYAGLGNLDSAWLGLWTYDADGREYIIDSVSKAGLPCTLLTTLHSNVGDTLMRHFLRIDARMYDSLGDSSFTANFRVNYKVKLK